MATSLCRGMVSENDKASPLATSINPETIKTMKTDHSQHLCRSAAQQPLCFKISTGIASVLLVTGLPARASTDYGPAIWNPPCNSNWYVSGNGHKFHVVDDMEGYYASVIS